MNALRDEAREVKITHCLLQTEATDDFNKLFRKLPGIKSEWKGLGMSDV